MYNKSKADVSEFELGFVLFCRSFAKEIETVSVSDLAAVNSFLFSINILV